MRMDPDLAAWLLGKVTDRMFKDVTHGVEFAVAFLKKCERPDGSFLLIEPNKDLLHASAPEAKGKDGASKTESTKRQ